MWRLTLAALLGSAAAILSDKGCICATVRGATTTPGAATGAQIGCNFQPTIAGAPSSRICLVDWLASTAGTCTTALPVLTGFGSYDTCANAAFTAFSVVPNPVLLEFDQTPLTWYTGQYISFTWAAASMIGYARILYTPTGTGIRPQQLTYPCTSGAALQCAGAATVRTPLVSDNSYTVRIGEQLVGGGGGAPSNLVVGTAPAFFIYAGNSSATVNASTRVGPITIKPSSVKTISAYYPGTGLSILGGCNCGGTCPCAYISQNITVKWQSVGMAQFGTAVITIISGGGNTLTTLTVPASANVTVSIPIPSNANTFSSYNVRVTVSGGGSGASYTTSSATTFKVLPAVATVSSTPGPASASPTISNTPSVSPSISNSPSPSPTISNTPSTTPTIGTSPSNTPSNSATPSHTVTPTISVTSSVGGTPSQTPTTTVTASVTPSGNPASLGKTVGASGATDSGTLIVGAAIGAVVVALGAVGGFVLWQRKHRRRSKKSAFSSKGSAADAQMLYLGPAAGYATPGLQAKAATRAPSYSKRHLDEEESEDEKPAKSTGGGSKSKLTVTKGATATKGASSRGSGKQGPAW